MFAVLVFLASGSVLGQEVSDPSKTNVLLVDLSTPQLAPGETGLLAFTVSNPYPWAMEGTSLLVEIYDFRTSSVSMTVDELESPPIFQESASTSTLLNLTTVEAGSGRRVELTVVTAAETPAGSIFTQGSYFIRFRLEFDYPGGHAVMVSRGFYTGDEWAYAVREATSEEKETYRYVRGVNYTYLGEVLDLASIDGVLPDSGFGVKERLPMWPFQLLIGTAALAFLLAIYHHRRETRGNSKHINRRRR